MTVIPNTMNGVEIDFAPGVNRSVSTLMLTAMEQSITDSIEGHAVERIWVSSANDSHSCPSRHTTGNGVDISRINGKRIGLYYESNASVKTIVDGFQKRFESADSRRENYGPTISKKEGVDKTIPGHKDHIHWSVNGDHSACSYAFLQYAKYYLFKLYGKHKEICNT